MTRPTEVCTCTGRGDMLCVGCYNRTRRLADPCYELRQERDEARAERDRMWSALQAEVATGVRVRGELRAEVGQLNGDLTRLSDHYQALMRECDEKDREIKRLQRLVSEPASNQTARP